MLGVYRTVAVGFAEGNLVIHLIDDLGLVVLGLVLIGVERIHLNKTLLFLLLALLYALLADLQILDPRLTALLAGLIAFGLFLLIAWKLLVFLFGGIRPRQMRRRTTSSEQLIPKPDQMLTPEAGHQSYLSCRDYLARDALESKRTTVVGDQDAPGLRWRFGPLCLEHYFGDVEPQTERGGPSRLVIWQPLCRIDTPTGWHRTKLLKHIEMTGFAKLPADSPHWSYWSEHAKRHRNKWLKQNDWEIFEPPVEEFIAAYKKSGQGPLLKSIFSKLLRRLKETQGGHVHILGARRRKPNARMEAGLVFLDIPEARQGKHFISFIHHSAKDSAVGYGLIDEWFRSSAERGRHTLDFGVFWAPGDPESWQGFSRFKSQFNITYVRHPRQLVRFIR